MADAVEFRRHSQMPFQLQPTSMIGGPYVLLVFGVGIIFLCIGTFITSLALTEGNFVFKIVGPTLLAVGGLLLTGSILICCYACYKNRNLQKMADDDMDDGIFMVGDSTFYKEGMLFDVHPNDFSASHRVSYHDPAGFGNHNGVANPYYPAAEASHPDRRISTEEHPQMVRAPPNIRIVRADSKLQDGSLDLLSAESMRDVPHSGSLYTGMDGALEDPDSRPVQRGHTDSFAVAQSARYTPKLRRHATVTPGSHPSKRLQFQDNRSPQGTELPGQNLQRQLRKNSREQQYHSHHQLADLHLPPGEYQKSSSVNEEWKSLRRNSKKRDKTADEKPKVYPLPSYSPEILEMMTGLKQRPSFERAISQPSPKPEAERFPAGIPHVAVHSPEVSRAEAFNPSSAAGKSHHLSPSHSTENLNNSQLVEDFLVSEETREQKRRPSVTMGLQALRKTSPPRPLDKANALQEHSVDFLVDQNSGANYPKSPRSQNRSDTSGSRQRKRQHNRLSRNAEDFSSGTQSPVSSPNARRRKPHRRSDPEYSAYSSSASEAKPRKHSKAQLVARNRNAEDGGPCCCEDSIAPPSPEAASSSVSDILLRMRSDSETSYPSIGRSKRVLSVISSSCSSDSSKD